MPQNQLTEPPVDGCQYVGWTFMTKPANSTFNLQSIDLCEAKYPHLLSLASFLFKSFDEYSLATYNPVFHYLAVTGTGCYGLDAAVVATYCIFSPFFHFYQVLLSYGGIFASSTGHWNTSRIFYNYTFCYVRNLDHGIVYFNSNTIFSYPSSLWTVWWRNEESIPRLRHHDDPRTARVCVVLIAAVLPHPFKIVAQVKLAVEQLALVSLFLWFYNAMVEYADQNFGPYKKY